jgi:hypothetical protein
MKTTFGFDVKRLVLVGVGAGVLFMMAPSCSGSKPPPVTCSSDNCTGCCDDSNSCNDGNTTAACGSAGVTCQQCSSNQVCVTDGSDAGANYQCRIGGTGGGSGGGLETGGGAGGGSAMGGGNGGGSTDGGCNATNCANGCCFNGTQCILYAQENFSRCGKAGAACSGCQVGKACQMGVCSAPMCDACLDSAGNCRTDKQTLTDDHYCGRDGGVCAVCDTTNGAMCTDGKCISNSTQCNASNCDGCCSGNTCIGLADGGINDAQCGAGASQCATCTNATCDHDAGVCVGGGGNDGGLFPFPDGGFSTCDSSNCPTGCCDFLFGCMMDGQDPTGSGIIVDCVDATMGPGGTCKTCIISCASGICM